MKPTTLFPTMQKVMTFALPMSAGAIINAITNFISMMMVASIGKTPLAAGSLAITTFMTITTVSVTIFYAVGILISHHQSQHKTAREIGAIAKNGFWLAFFLAFPTGLALWYADHLLLFFKQDPTLVALARPYFHFAAMSMLPLLAGVVIAQFYAGIGKPRFTLLMALISLPLTLLLAYGLILGHFGLPQLGLSGVAFANLVVQFFMLVMVLTIMSFRKNIQSYELFNQPFSPNWSICKSIFTLGLPIGLQFGGEFVAITLATYLMGYFGVTALAASQIVGQYYMLSIIFMIGLTQALSILTSQAYGKNNLPLIKSYLIASIVLFIIGCLIISILFLGFPHTLIQFYTDENIVDNNLEHLTIIFFAISAVLLLLDGFRHVLSGALRGLHDSHGPMRIGILTLWFISLPMAYLLGFIFHGGPIGLRIGFLSGFLVAVIWLSMRMRNHFLKQGHG